jgi:hypothetical protein
MISFGAYDSYRVASDALRPYLARRIDMGTA